jgi:hypothetical protein
MTAQPMIRRFSPAELANYYRLLEERTGPCIDWDGTIDDRGYGRATGHDGAWSHAHRVVYEAAFGVLPDEIEVRHRCDRPSCVNLEHLVEGTHEQNAHDAAIRGALRAGETHWNSRLTEAQVREIQTSTESQYVLAARYGVTQPHVSRLRRRQAWSHVKPRPHAA